MIAENRCLQGVSGWCNVGFMTNAHVQKDILNGLFKRENDGIFIRTSGIPRALDEYNDALFDILMDLQSHHFWHRGRHRFVHYAFRRFLPLIERTESDLRVIDLGAGCGGWVQYLKRDQRYQFSECAMGDSYRRPLELARECVGDDVNRYHVDLMDMGWRDRWDVVFLMDVIEHIDADIDIVRRVRDVLRPGGLLFITVPALSFFWTINDEVTGHHRRYARVDCVSIAKKTGMDLIQSRYFMFLLSPLYYISRLWQPDYSGMSEQEIAETLAKVHRIPSPIINRVMGWIFNLETPLGSRIPFPWGTSLLAVYQRPHESH
ncbi:methyltransferase domain-containing protein [bacterium]|nr:methyltransferase domain-containing protein [candidate division CSSED10-310 bacterium]